MQQQPVKQQIVGYCNSATSNSAISKQCNITQRSINIVKHKTAQYQNSSTSKSAASDSAVLIVQYQIVQHQEL